MQDRDRNLLFAVLAVQLKGVSPQRVLEAAGAWMVDPSRPLSARLQESGILRAEDVALLDHLVDEAVRTCRGDAAEALNSIHGADVLRASLQGGAAPATGPKDRTRPMNGTARFELEGDVLSAVEEIPGRYSQISEQGRGGMGRVLLVHDECLGRDIALKELLLPHDTDYTGPPPSPMRETTAMLARFLREARVTGQLEHPAIIPVYELGRRRNGTLYYTMKLVRGRTLSDAIRDAGTLEARLRLLQHLMGLCQALAYAHSRSVVHRDIKPANMMIGEFGETVLLDWGLAKIVGQADVHAEELKESLRILKLGRAEETPQTVVGEAVGTPHYMSPEQAEGRIEDLDYRSDVYSVGAVLYELLTGEPPFSGRTAEEILRQVVSEEPKPIIETVPDAPPELVSICRKAMHKDPAKRYASMLELRDELVRFATGAYVQAYRYGPGEVLRRFYGRHKAVINTALAGVFALLCLGVYSYVSIWQARNREHEQRVTAELAQEREAKARYDAEQETYLSKLRLAELQLASNDIRLANDTLWSTQESLRGWEWAFLLNKANRDMFTVETPEAVAYAAVFSPDGSKLGTSSYPRPPAIWDAHTGSLIQALENSPCKQNSIAFTADGARFVAAGENGSAFVWDVSTGRLLHTFTADAVAYDAVPAGHSSRLYVGYDDQTVRVWDMESGQPAATWQVGAGPVWNIELNADETRLLTESGQGVIQIWDTSTGASVCTVGGYLARFSPSGAVIAAADPEQNMAVLLWDAAAGALVHRLEGHERPVYSLRFEPSGARLLSASFDGTVRLWDVAAGAALRSFETGSAAVQAFEVDAGKYVLACSGDNMFSLWDAATGRRIYAIRGRGAALRFADQSPDGLRLATASAEPFFQVWHILEPSGLRTLDYEASPPSERSSEALGVVLSADGRRAAAWWNDFKATVYDCAHLSAIAHFQSPFPHYPQAVALSGDGARAVMVLDDFTPTVWDTAKPGFAAAYNGHAKWVKAAAITPDGAKAASGSWDGSVHVWDAATGAGLAVLEGHAAPVTAVQFRPDGQALLTASMDGTAVVWSVSNGEKLWTQGEPRAPVTGAAFNESGRRVITACADGNVYVWDPVTGTRLESLVAERQGAARGVFDLRVNIGPDDKLIITRSRTDATRVWHGQSHALLLSLDVSDALLPLPDRQSALLAGADGVLRVVQTAPWRTEQREHCAGATWQEQYADYRMRQGQETHRPVHWRASGTVFLAADGETLAEGLQTLSDAAAGGGAPFAGGLVRIPQPVFGPTLADIGLEPDDAVSRVDSAPLKDGPDAAAQLAALAGRLRAGEGAARLTVVRDGAARDLHYVAGPKAREETQTTIRRADAQTLVGECARFLVRSRDHPEWTRLYGPVRVLLDAEVNDGLLNAAGLSPYDVVIGMNAERFSDAGRVQESFRALAEGLAGGGVAEFSLTVRRGAFRELELQYTVQ